jgi:DNA primase
VLNFDPDVAGSAAAERAIQLFLDESMRVRVLTLEGGLDPDAYVKEKGVEAYQAKIQQASNYFYWLADRARTEFDTRTAEGRMQAFRFLLPAVKKIPDTLERAAVAADVAAYLGVEPGLVREQFRRAGSDPRAVPMAARRTTIPALERILLNAILSSEDARAEALPRISKDLIGGLVTHEIFTVILLMTEAGAPMDLAAIDCRLGDAAKTLLHEAISADDREQEDVSLDEVRSCLRVLENEQRKRRRADIELQLRTAEREGRMEEALRFAQERDRLRREELS